MNPSLILKRRAPKDPIRGALASGMVVMFLMAIGLAKASAEPTPEEVKLSQDVKLAVIQKIADFVEWPNFDDPSQKFVIGVAGTGGMAEAFEAKKFGMVKGHSVEIKKVSKPDDAVTCQVLWIAESEEEHLALYLEKTLGKPVLTVADTTAFLKMGVVIVLKPVDGRIGFDVNRGPAAKGGLKFSTKLLSLAKVVLEP